MLLGRLTPYATAIAAMTALLLLVPLLLAAVSLLLAAGWTFGPTTTVNAMGYAALLVVRGLHRPLDAESAVAEAADGRR